MSRIWLMGLRPPASTMSSYSVWRLMETPEVRLAHQPWEAKLGRPVSRAGQGRWCELVGSEASFATSWEAGGGWRLWDAKLGTPEARQQGTAEVVRGGGVEVGEWVQRVVQGRRCGVVGGWVCYRAQRGMLGTVLLPQPCYMLP
jgi:hypothetical protein